MNPLSWKDLWTDYMAFVDPGEPIRHRTTDNVTTKFPRKGYVDGGLILSKPVVISQREFHNMSYEEWQRLKPLLDSIPNLVVEEERDQQLTMLSCVTPVITSMAATKK